MKKLLTILTMLLASISIYAETETKLWEDTYADGIELNSETISKFKAGDILRVYVTVPDGGANFKIVYKGAPDWSETTIPSINNQWPWVNGGETYKDFTLTADDITAFTGKNIYIYKGENSTITKVSLITEDSSTPRTEQAISIQDVVMGNWTGFVTVNKTYFSVASVGDVLKIYAKDVEEGAQISLKDQSNGWPALEESTQYPNLTGTSFEYTIPDETVLNKLKNYGLVVGGQKYTYVKTTLATAATLTTRTFTYDISPAEGGTVEVRNGGTEGEVTTETVFPQSTQLGVIAKPASGYQFEKWKLSNGEDDNIITTASFVCTLEDNIHKTAVFTANAIPAFSLDGFVQDDSGEATYNAETHTLVTTTSNWKGASLWIGDNSTYSGNKLVVRTSTASKLKVMVYYVGVEAAAEISDADAVFVRSLTLDNTKKIKSVVLQNQEAGTITFTEFALDPSYTLTITEPTNGSFTVNDGTNNLANGASVAYGTTLTLTATPATNYSFTKWTVNGTDYTENPQTITMTEATTVAATFDTENTFVPDSNEETILSTETKALGTDWGGYVQVTTVSVIPTTAKAGDQIKVYVKDVDNDGGSWQLKTTADSWPVLSTASSGTITSSATSYTYTLTAADITALNANNLVVTGINYTVVGVTFVVGEVVTPVFDENGKADLSKFVADAGVTYSYNSTSVEGTITTGEEAYKGVSLSIPEDDRVNATKLTIKFEEAASAYVHITYANDEGWVTDGAHQVSGNGTELSLPLNYSTKVSNIHIQLTAANTSAMLTEVSVSNKCTLTTVTEGGSITVKKGEKDVTGTTEFDYGTVLTLTATPGSTDETFKQWKIGDEVITDNPYTLTMNGNVNITAQFKYSDPNMLWKGEKAVTWGEYQEIETDMAFNVADQIVIEVQSTIADSDWPAVGLHSRSSENPLVDGTARVNINSTTETVTYYLSNKMLTDIQTNGGFLVGGNGYTLKSVKKVAGNGGEGYEKSVWIGNTVYNSSWSVSQSVAPSCFSDAVAGNLLRVKVKDLKVSPTISLCENVDGWPALADGSTNIALSGGYAQLTLTDDMLTKLKTNGLIMSGVSFTLTSVDILNADDIKPLTLAVDVENNWIFSSAPTITIKVTNPYDVAMTANAELQVTTDKLDAYTTLTQSVSVAANGSENIALTFPSTPPAGFYKATALVNGDLARSFYFGVNPTQIVSAPDKQSDFDSYWTAAKDQLAAVEATDEPVLTELTDRSSATRKVYLVEMKSIADGTSGEPVTIRGYYAEPQDGKKHPVLIHYQGYDSGMGPGGVKPAVYIPSADGSTSDYAEFVLSTRGQVANNRTAAERGDGLPGDFVNTYGDWFAFNFGDKNSYYYRGAYMDCVRAVDFMASRSTSDMDNLFAEGQSQGGAFTVAAAALSGRTFKAIAPAITFMGDFPDYFQIASWPASVAKANQGTMTDAEMYAFLSYYDTKNLATMISCPYITSIGVQDNVCPPHTNIAPYNNVTTAADDKQVIFNAELQHATNSEWNSTFMAFFDTYKTVSDNRTEKTINGTSTEISADPEQGLTIDKVKFTNASSGDIIKVYVSNVASGATITMKEAGGDWSELTSGSISGDNYSYTLSAADVEKIKANGLHIMGNGFTSTKVTLKTEGEIPADGEDPEPPATGVNITLDDLNEGWNSSYDATTKTITTTGEWAARGWYISDNRYNDKGSITVGFKAAEFSVTLKMEYINSSEASKSVDATASAGETQVTLDIPADIKTMGKVYITFEPVGSLELTSATVNDKVVDKRTEKTLVEKSQTIADGDIAINRGLFSNAVVGDEIRIYADNLSESSKLALEPGDYSGAFDGANWTGFTESPFKLKLTATLIATIKEKGLLVRGENYTFKKAILYTEKELGSEISDDEEKKDEEKKDEETIIDEKTGEADLTELTAQDATKTTLTQNEDGSITMTTTEPYCAAQIWFNDPESVNGNVLKVELAESSVNVTVTVKYTDGSESQMSANTMVAKARGVTRAVSSGSTIEVPLDAGKEVQNIEVKNNVAGTITIKKMQVTTVNVFTGGVANLAMLKPQSNATYDTSAHTLATTKGWTGATISPVAGENVSGKELLIEFKDASKVKVSVKYRTDVEGPSKIMDKAATSVRLALDNSKNIQEITIQPTEAAIVTFTKIAVNSEETDDGSLKPGKTITLWESATGETLAWNEVAKQDASVGEMLQEYDELLITVSGVTEGCDWPKVFIRDANSDQAGNEVLLNDIASFPYTVRIVLTGEMAQQLSKGFSICGDGVTVKKLQVYRPQAPKTGDIHLADLNYGYNSSYDKSTYTITTTSRWAARGWEIGDKRYNDKNLITVKFEPVDFPVTLKMEYTTGLQTAQATSVGVPAGRTELLLEIPKGISKLNRVYIIYENPGSVKLTEASVTYQDNLKLSTAIKAFEVDGVIRDGRYDTDGWYNLRGMRIPEPKTSGVYIHGGKKVVIY